MGRTFGRNWLTKAVIIGTFFCSQLAVAQDETLFLEYEERISTLADQILSASEQKERVAANDELLLLLPEVLTLEKSFKYPFENIRSMSILSDEDARIRIFNWTVPQANGTYMYHGFVHYYHKAEKVWKLVALNDKSDMIPEAETQTLSAAHWYGALYVNMVSKKTDQGYMHTLIGWDGNRPESIKKMVDVLTITPDGSLQFGAPIFQMDEQVQQRLILEYSSNARISVTYHEDLDMIVYDQLVPIDPSMEGIFQFYVPNLNFDGLQFKKDHWELVHGVQINNDKKQDTKRHKKLQRGIR